MFSYVKPTMLELAGHSATMIPLILSLFGLAMVVASLSVEEWLIKALKNHSSPPFLIRSGNVYIHLYFSLL